GQQPQYVVFVTYPLLVYFWYMRLKPAKTIQVGEGDQVVFVSALGKRTVAISELQEIRPFFELGRNNFVVKYQGGNEYLFDDPATVALLVRDILTKNPAVRTRGIPNLPPSRE